jgi:hypothetical protein
MMLAHVVGAESDAIVELDQLQPVFVLFPEQVWPVVVLIEYPELHGTTLQIAFSRAGGYGSLSAVVDARASVMIES